jgi:SAM-dependent methyltransferase
MGDAARRGRRAPGVPGWLGDAPRAPRPRSLPSPPRAVREGPATSLGPPRGAGEPAVRRVPRPRAAAEPGQRGSDLPPRQRSAAELDRLAPLAPNAWLRYAVVERMFPPGVTDVLEIGCGRGGFAARLAQRYNYLGLEPDRESWAQAGARLGAIGRGEVRNEPAEALRSREFDLVCAFEVLEHLEDDAAALARWASLVRPGGWLLLSVPAHQHRFGPWDEFVGHYRRYDRDAITALLTGAGFGEVSARLYGFPLGYLLEPARNVVGWRRRAASAGQSPAERTSGSGRQMQPANGALGTTVRLSTKPFRLLQDAVPWAGTGLVVRARLGRPRSGPARAGVANYRRESGRSSRRAAPSTR